MAKKTPEQLAARKREYMRRYRAANRAKLNAHARARWRHSGQRNSALRRYYGITIADYNAMLEEQRGCCALCGKPVGEKLAVDHDHTTGRVRGLLCILCNSLLGWYERNHQKIKSYTEEI